MTEPTPETRSAADVHRAHDPRKTAKSVIIADLFAGGVIRTGGMLVILAVVGILAFLLATVVPLFQAARVHEQPVAGRVPIEGTLRGLGVDEYRMLAFAVGDDPVVAFFRLDSSEPVTRFVVPGLEGTKIAAFHRTVRTNEAVLATTDGRLAFLDLGFASDFVLDERQASLRASMKLGEQKTLDGGVVQRVAGGNLRRVVPRVGLRGVLALPAGSAPVVAVGYASSGEVGAAVAVTAAGAFHLVREAHTESLTGEATREYALAPVAEKGPGVPADPIAALVDEEVRVAWIVGGGGELLRIDLLASPALRRQSEAILASRPAGSRVGAAELLIGGRSIAVADDSGGFEVWSLVPVDVPAPNGNGTWVALLPDGSTTLPAIREQLAEAVEKGGRLHLLARGDDPGAGPSPVDVRVLLGKDRAAAKTVLSRRWRAATPEEVEEALHGDGRRIARLHEFDRFPSRIVHIAPGITRRTVYLSHADGSFTAAYSTNERVVGRAAAFTGPLSMLVPGSKDDGLLVVGPGLGYKGFEVDAPHPETSVSALFLPVHYEGYARPQFLYQSTSGTDEAETKLSLTPLLYGTLKATFYAMFFALPLAILAAIYTSQFMHHRVRALVKPGIEVMASLPSVVLGFLAALMIAPFVENVVPAVFATVVGVPIVAFLAGALWHVLPQDWKHGASSAVRLGIAIVIVAGVAATALALNGHVQRWFFSGPLNETGDFRTWLRGEEGTGSGLPLLRAALIVIGGTLGMLLVPRWFRVELPDAAPFLRSAARVAVYAFLPGMVLVVLAWPIEALLFGGDFRRFLVGPEGEIYDQRNSLVVGVAMGFAVIPIIYTIAEDALYAIPDALKSASLACGASPWQTAMRVVVPAAAPGIFSAIMIGLGRAVGETMIVLMATGGTPIMDASIFNGFRTLSANIAIELSEAPEGGTLYRVLFLAGLLLFALTFVVNTIAEIVRLRFRRKFKLL